jgi:hypothetical protein
LVSFHHGSPAFWFNGLEEGANFPVALATAQAWNIGAHYCWVHQKVGIRREVDEAHKLGLIWWPSEGVDYPILGILPRVLGFVKGQSTSDAWAELEALEADDREIQLATFNTSKQRFSLLSHLKLTSRDLRSNLLKYRDEWRSIGSPNVAYFLSLEASDRAIIRASLVEPTLKSILTGAKYPPAIAPNLELNLPLERITALWEINTLYRELNMSTKTAPIDNVAIPEMNLDDGPPTLEGYTQDALVGLNPAEVASFWYGVLLALYAEVQRMYHQKARGKQVAYKTPYLRQSVKTFMGVTLRNLEAYRSVLGRNEYRVFQIISDYLDATASKLTPALLQEIRPGNALTQLGWLRGRHYCRLLSAFNTQYWAAHNEKAPEDTETLDSSDSDNA